MRYEAIDGWRPLPAVDVALQYSQPSLGIALLLLAEPGPPHLRVDVRGEVVGHQVVVTAWGG